MERVALPLWVAVLASVAVVQPMPAQRPVAPQTGAEGGDAARTDGLQPEDPLGKRISIMLVDEPLARALATIAAQSGVRFTYSSDDLPPVRRVSLARHDVSIGTVLQLVLAGTSLHPIVMRDGAIVLSAGPAPPTTSEVPAPKLGVLTGRIVKPGGDPIGGTTIGLAGTSDTTVASDSGRFRIGGIVPGTYRLWARQVGFRARSMPIVIPASSALPLTITLVPTVADLPPVTTTQIHRGYRGVGFDQRMRGGIGEFMTYEQIVQSHATRLTQLLQRLSVVTFAELPSGYDGPALLSQPWERGTVGGVWIEGTCVAVAVDEVALGVLDTREIDNLIDMSEVGAIEVYRAFERPGSSGPETIGAQTPLALVGNWDPVSPHCTLVVIWSRQRLGIPSAEAPAANSNGGKYVLAPPDTLR